MKIAALARYRRAKLRNRIRALKRLNASAQPFQPVLMYQRLLSDFIPPGLCFDADPVVAGLGAEAPSHCLSQTLFKYTFLDGLISSLSCCIADPRTRVVLPLPSHVYAKAEQAGIRVARLRSFLAWQRFKLRALLDGVRRIARIVLTVQADPADIPPFSDGAVFLRSDDFAGLGRKQMASRWSFVKWFRTRSKLGGDQPLILHRMASPPTDAPLPAGVHTTFHTFAPRPRDKRQLYRHLAAVFGRAVIGLFGRDWWATILLREIADLHHAASVPADAFAKTYFVPLNHKIIRFLWTYHAEALGNKFWVLHYSHSCRDFHPNSPDLEINSPGYAIQSWPGHVVWSDDHVRGLRENGVTAPCLVDPPLFFLGEETQFSLNRPFVAMFDVDAYRISTAAKLGFSNPYYQRASHMAFLRETVLAVREAGAVPVWKSKGIDRYDCPRPFRRLAEELSIDLLPSAAIPPSAIEHAVAAISMPFTTSAAAAVAMGKPSCYFDPTGVLAAHGRYAFGAPLIVGRPALVAWLKEVLARRA